MEFNITKKIGSGDSSERVLQVLRDFDMTIEHAQESFSGSIDIEGKEWNVGLIVGASGTGKSTIAKEVFGNAYIRGYEYSSSSVLDDMPADKDIKEIELAFTSVGFASPPSWLKPYDVLSTGEKMRVDLARAILSNQGIICFDEFTSVVDRNVAKTSCIAVSNAIRHSNKQFIAVTCHEDVVEWLQPDWVFCTDDMTSSFLYARALAASSPSESAGKKNGRSLGAITI